MGTLENPKPQKPWPCRPDGSDPLTSACFCWHGENDGNLEGQTGKSLQSGNAFVARVYCKGKEKKATESRACLEMCRMGHLSPFLEPTKACGWGPKSPTFGNGAPQNGGFPFAFKTIKQSPSKEDTPTSHARF